MSSANDSEHDAPRPPPDSDYKPVGAGEPSERALDDSSGLFINLWRAPERSSDRIRRRPFVDTTEAEADIGVRPTGEPAGLSADALRCETSALSASTHFEAPSSLGALIAHGLSPRRGRVDPFANPMRAADEPVAADDSDEGAHFPTLGETLAGFRIVSELGRGAFARVYLAEQADLADRLVALKVSEGLGAEPQILARLQHTHIVPVHSVHDLPGTSLRMLCMPYLGGANLAQVLQAAGARVPSLVTGRSLVDALDQIGEDNAARELASAFGPRKASTWRPFDPSGRYGRAATRGIGSPSTVRSIWGRYWARMPWWKKLEGGELEPGDLLELAEPARSFLRQASYIHAAVWIAACLAEALEHAHARGLLHRDLKPSNILIAADGTPMLLDFNLSADTIHPGDPDHGARALVGGTLPYMAPEHLDAFSPLGTTPPEAVDARSDLYALGLILFEMIAGRHAFADPPNRNKLTDVLAVMIAERKAGAPSLREACPQVPWGIDAIVRKCLEPEPERRYQSAHDLADDLRRFLDDQPLRHVHEPSLRECAAKWARRNPRAVSSTSVALLASVLILALGGVLSLVADNLTLASAHLSLDGFQQAFSECQLLLNTTSGPREHLDEGIDRADQALAAYSIGRDDRWLSRPSVHRLPLAQQNELREQAAELILLLARAQVFVAEREADEPEHRQALEDAVAWLDIAEKVDPNPTAALYDDRARYRIALGLADEAARDQRLRKQTPPRTSRDFALLGTSALAQKKLALAEAQLQHAVALDARRFWAWFALGLCHADQKRSLEAAGDFAVCTALVPSFAWPHLNRGLALARAGRLAEARAAYDRALAINPRFAEALVNRALVCLELNDPKQAALDFEAAIVLGRHDASLQAAHAEALSRLGRRNEARATLLDLVERSPNDAAMRVAYGFFLLGDPSMSAEADSQFAAALDLDPNNARAHLGRAYLLRKTNAREALGEATRAYNADPNLHDALQLRALLLSRLNDPTALADINRLLEAPSAHSLYNAACALAILSRNRPDEDYNDRALDLLRRAIDAGLPREGIATDPDLEGLKRMDGFREIVGEARQKGPGD